VHTSSHPPVPPAPLLTGLGQALRWLRERQSRKQYRVADDAGITKGMLSAYETGRQRPSLETLDKLLETLRCDLNDLHNALQIVNGRPEQLKGWRDAITPGAPATLRSAGAAGAPSAKPIPPGAGDSRAFAAWPPEIGRLGAQRRAWPTPPIPPTREVSEVHEPPHLYDVLGLDQLRQAPLAPEEEQALDQMLEGFHSLLRYWHRSLAALATLETPAPDSTPKTAATDRASATSESSAADAPGEIG
jgi:transcriptional regulator with XRE-family HTH domain